MEIIINGQSYALRLSTKRVVELEKRLGKSPISILFDLDKGEIPKVGDIIIILHSMLQDLNNGITLDKTFDLYDMFLADGKTMFDIIPIFIEVFKHSGLIKIDEESKNQ